MFRFFCAILTPFPRPPSSHIRGPPPPESTSHISDPLPRFLEGLVQKPGQKPLCTNSVSIVRGGFCLWGGLSGGLFMSIRLCPGWCLSVPVMSEYICYI